MNTLSIKKAICWSSTTALIAWVILGAGTVLRGDELPATSDRGPVATPHFPDAMHAFIWRNWQLVEADRLASVLETTTENVADVAASMGLPRRVSTPPQMLDRGYITLVRRNWHLLPHKQLTELLGVSEAELAHRLREDDFLYIKLGSAKPLCDPVTYTRPDAAAQQQAAEIKAVVQEHFGNGLAEPSEPRLGFVEELGKLPSGTPPATARSASTSGLRMIYSYFATFGDPLADASLATFPEGLLARLSSQGVNAIWLHSVLRQLAPGGPDFPEFGAGHELRLANLRKLIERAGKYGIDVYLYVNEPRAMPKAFFAGRPDMAGVAEGDYVTMCTSDPRVRRWLGDALAFVFREAPGLGGVFTITASENLTNCASHGKRSECPRCARRTDAEIIAEVNEEIAEGVHRSAPEASVIAWDWGWNGHGDARDVISLLPGSVALMSVSEWALPIERGGVRSTVGEYSLSAVGPGPRATQHWAHARQQGLKTVAKVQLTATWELAALPYLPVLDLVAEHCHRLASAGVDGMMLSWSVGGYPSLNLELAQAFAKRPVPERTTALEALALRHFGPEAAPQVRQAWTKFSEAFREYPYSGATLYTGPQQMGPANLLYGEPTGYAATMVGYPYDDLQSWRGPYPAETFIEQFEKLARGWSEGLRELEAASRLVPPDRQSAARADLRVAEAALLHFQSVANQSRFILARDEIRQHTDPTRGRALRREMLAILDREIELARRMFALASADSRLGYEASNHYFYVPLDLVEKVVNCSSLKQQLTDSTDE